VLVVNDRDGVQHRGTLQLPLRALAAAPGRPPFGGGVSAFLLFILGSSLGGVGPVRGLRGGGRRGWCKEWARSG